MPGKRKAVHHFHEALRDVRLARKMAQTDFPPPSSQRYISELERQVLIPSLTKIENLAEGLSVHPLTLLAVAYLKKREADSLHALMQTIEDELKELSLLGPSGKPAPRPERLPRG